jgi:hypothetical protein
LGRPFVPAQRADVVFHINFGAACWRTMMADEKEKKAVITTIEATNGEADNSLLPMLVAGLVLIVVGAIVVMTFV